MKQFKGQTGKKNENRKSVFTGRVSAAASDSVQNSYIQKVGYKKLSYNSNSKQNPVISGYFVSEKSYKEIIISRINAVLCGVLGFLVVVCLVSYYFVVDKELELRKLSKETIALNLDNADMQNKLDNMQSYSKVDMEVSKLNILKRANQVIELSAAELPDVNYDKGTGSNIVNRFLGY